MENQKYGALWETWRYSAHGKTLRYIETQIYRDSDTETRSEDSVIETWWKNSDLESEVRGDTYRVGDGYSDKETEKRLGSKRLRNRRLERKRLRHVEIQGIDYKIQILWGRLRDIETQRAEIEKNRD